jgi:predicted acyltransferase
LWLRTNRTSTRKAAMLAVTGVVFLGMALAWNPFFPINKKLWTSSYTLYAGGWSLLLLAAAIFFVDIWRVGRTKRDSGTEGPETHPALYKPVLVLGTNAILAYMISELGDSVMNKAHTASGTTLKIAAFHAITAQVPAANWSSLLYSLIFLLVCWLLVVPFYWKRIFLRIG